MKPTEEFLKKNFTEYHVTLTGEGLMLPLIVYGNDIEIVDGNICIWGYRVSIEGDFLLSIYKMTDIFPSGTTVRENR